MAAYNSYANAVDTPFSEPYDEYYEDEFEIEVIDHSQQMRIRMMLILGVVAALVTTFALLILPGSDVSADAVAGPPAAPDLASEPVAAIESQVVSAPQLEVQESAQIIEETGIAPFFTPSVQYWAPQIVRWSEEHGIDANIIATIMQIESCGDAQAVSVAGARGLFQVMPFHFTNGEDMQDPDTNARRGMNFYNEQLRYTGGDILLSFAGYNGGYAASGGAYATWPNETQRYYEWAKGIYEDASANRSSSETLSRWLEAGGGPACQRTEAQLNLN